MIKIQFNYSADFLGRYENEILVRTLRPNIDQWLNRMPLEYNEVIRPFFSGEALKEIIFCPAENLSELITSIYDQVPILAERYCPEYYLRGIVIEEDYQTINIRTNQGRIEIREKRDRLIEELEAIIVQRNSVFISDLIFEVRNVTQASTIKKFFKKLLSLSSGTYQLQENDKDKFADWVNRLPEIFNYDSMASTFSYEITSALGINICPYCNYEDTETIIGEGARARPDLDHFHPKSKFPFLALTLSNLIPSGHRCNKNYKKSQSMLNYEHPYISGVEDETIFYFEMNYDQERNPEDLNIKVIDGIRQLPNMDFFKIKDIYNKDDIKTWFLDFHERYEYRRSLDQRAFQDILNEPDLIKKELALDILISPKKAQAQKFKIDMLRQLSGVDYPMAP